MDIDTLTEYFRGNKPDGELTGHLALGYLNATGINEDDALQKQLLEELLEAYVTLEKRVDSLLKNTLPEKVAEEIKFNNTYTPKQYDSTILFSDFVGFTKLAENIPPQELIATLHRIFTGFDNIINKFKGTKIKTIGDAYMAVFGAPKEFAEHPEMAIRAAMAMADFLATFNQENKTPFEMRVGIHSGSVMAGVVGTERMQFDIFGDNVNIASRYESAGKKGKINVSQETYMRTQDKFAFEARGKISLKNKPAMDAYFVKMEHEVKP